MLSVAVKKRRGSFSLDACFELPTPGVVALFGRSGCGKTTLVNVIAGLLDADSGRVALDDVVFGCANQAGEDNRNVARMAALLAGLPTSASVV